MGFRLIRPVDEIEAVAQPLHGAAGVEDAAFEGVGGPAFEAVGQGRYQPVIRYHRFLAGVLQHETARAVSGLDRSGLQAGLTHSGRLLVPGHAGDGNIATEQFRRGDAERAAIVVHLGQEFAGDMKELEQVPVPRLRVDVDQQGARRIGGVGGVDAPACEAPQQETVHGAECEFSTLRRLPGAGDGVE